MPTYLPSPMDLWRLSLWQPLVLAMMTKLASKQLFIFQFINSWSFISKANFTQNWVHNLPKFIHLRRMISIFIYKFIHNLSVIQLKQQLSLENPCDIFLSLYSHVSISPRWPQCTVQVNACQNKLFWTRNEELDIQLEYLNTKWRNIPLLFLTTPLNGKKYCQGLL